MAQQIGQSGAVFPVCLMATPGFHLFAISQHDNETIFENVENRLPVGARAFHGHVRTSLFP